MTRTTTAHLFHSLNGVVESPDLWQFHAFGPEEAEMMTKALTPATDVVMGRKLWQEWSEYWQPKSGDPFAQWINPVRKHVLSSTLPDELPWNTTPVRTSAAELITALRNQGDGDIIVAGGIETVRSLFLDGLIDRLTLTTHPVIAGKGRRLFDDSVPLTRVELLEAVQTSSGNAVVTYRLRNDG